MIRFPCTCGHVFELPDDRSGGLEQCPACSRLNDIPTLSDLTNIADDGTFLIDEPFEHTDHISLGHLHEAFAPGTIDPSGREIDYRRVAVDPLALAVDPIATPRVAPRYDPVTGELIRPHEVDDEVALEALPVEEDGSDITSSVALAAQRRQAVAPFSKPRSLKYSVEARRRRINPATALLELLMPANVTVLFIIFLATYAAGMFGLLLSVGSQYVHFYLQVLNIPLWLLLAHYGCVIEDVGPDGMDELPRPLRFAELAGDIFFPLVHVLLAVVLSFAPAIAMLSPALAISDSLRETACLLLGLCGAIVFPAVLLTTVTGITIANLRPDRVFGVMIAGAGDYILAIAAFLISMLLTAAVFFVPVMNGNTPMAKFAHAVHMPYVMIPLCLVAVYATHYFCWLLGMIYRDHHGEFPWVLQHHVATPKAATRSI